MPPSTTYSKPVHVVLGERMVDSVRTELKDGFNQVRQLTKLKYDLIEVGDGSSKFLLIVIID